MQIEGIIRNFMKNTSMKADFLSSAKRQFEFYKQLGEKTFSQISDEALFWQHDVESNSIAIIVKHLWGNMRSRWTDFLTSDGEKEWRERDAEFENDWTTRAEMMEKWNAGWECLYQALDTLKTEDLDRIVLIRNQEHTVLEAISRQLAHYPYHIGQIVYIGKMVQQKDWKSLSIPKGQSDAYNADMFSK